MEVVSNGPPNGPLSAKLSTTASSAQAGVGIVFQPTDDGTLFVKRFLEGSPAERSGLIHPGDCLCEVNGKDVFRQPMDYVKSLLMGPPGTTVRLGFHRGTDPRSPLIQVALHRMLPGEELVGVGIIFRSDATGSLFVRQLQTGGPAELSREIEVGDCIVEVNGVDVFRKPISTFTKLILGAPGTIVTLGFKRGDSLMIKRVSLRRSLPQGSRKNAMDQDEIAVVQETNIKLRQAVEEAKAEHVKLKNILKEKQEAVQQLHRMYERGTSAMGGRMNEEVQRLKTFEHWPHTESSHPGVTPIILAADGFHFCPTPQDPDTVVCFFCDLQLGDWERSDDAKAVHRKLSPNCPMVLGLPCGNVQKVNNASTKLEDDAPAHMRLENVLARKATLLQAVTALETSLEDARRQIVDAIHARKKLQQEAAVLASGMKTRKND
mmetsp:Transcript_25308/g.83655  ORF Transcript_25308/g.83655 Transcript_25308/m.83655 type:complete len:434 (+) Transcript_25308:126-1427(+)